MCKAHEIALEKIQEFIRRGKPFKYSELAREILEKGGALRVAPNYPVLEYLSRLEYHGDLKRIGMYYIPQSPSS